MEVSEPIFTITFGIEMVIKVIAMGLVEEKKCYLRDAWNWIDFLVVVTGFMAFHPQFANMQILKTIRLFRPLRGLSAFKNMRVLVNTLLTSVVQLGNILGLILFFFVLFSIFGVSVWGGLWDKRCRWTPTPEDGDWPLNENDTRLCGGYHTCGTFQHCGSLRETEFYIEGDRK